MKKIYRYRDWKKRFEGAFGADGLQVVSLTGETSTDLKLVKDGTIIIATPEQWDVMSASIICCIS